MDRLERFLTLVVYVFAGLFVLVVTVSFVSEIEPDRTGVRHERVSLDLAPIDSAHQRCLETASSVMRKWVEDNFRRRGDRPEVKRWNFYLTRRRNAEGLKRLAVTVYADSNGPRWTYYRNFDPADCSKIYEYSRGWPTGSEDRIREFLMNKEAMVQRDLTPAEIRKAEERYAPGWLGEHCRAQVVAEVQSFMLEPLEEPDLLVDEMILGFEPRDDNGNHEFQAIALVQGIGRVRHRALVRSSDCKILEHSRKVLGFVR